MPAALTVALAVAALLLVAITLGRQVLALRAARREVDRYLRWLLEDAAGPVSPGPVSPGPVSSACPPPWR